MTELSTFLRFKVGDLWYGIRVDTVVEVLPMMMFNNMSGNSPDMLGLLTLRDQIVPIIDLRIRFGIASIEYYTDTPILVLRTPQGLIGAVVDEADSVVVASEDIIIPQVGYHLPYITAIIKHPEQLLLLLDDDLEDKSSAVKRSS